MRSGVDGGLEVLCQPSIAPDPREEPFDNPAPRVNSEANLIGVLAHDFHRYQRGLGELLTGIPAVGEDPLDEREDAPRSSHKRSAAVAILDAGRMRFEHKATPVRVDERMATIYRWFAAWRDDGRFERINHALVMADHERVGRDASPSAAIIDSQSVKTTEAACAR